MATILKIKMPIYPDKYPENVECKSVVINNKTTNINTKTAVYP